MKNVGIYRCIVGKWEVKTPNFIFVELSFYKEVLSSLYNTFWKPCFLISNISYIS